MRVAIIGPSNKVNVNGVARRVDLTGLDPNIHAVQWDGQKGHIEFLNRDPEQHITDLSEFQIFVDRWIAAAPPPPTLDQLKAAKMSVFVEEGVRRIAEVVPDWDTLDTIKTVAGLWVSHLKDNATAEQIIAKNIYQYVKITVAEKLALVPTETALNDVDPFKSDPFGDSNPWPF